MPPVGVDHVALDPIHEARERPRVERRLLRLAHLRRRDHLHRPGDLGGAADRADAATDRSGVDMALVRGAISFQSVSLNCSAACFSSAVSSGLIAFCSANLRSSSALPRGQEIGPVRLERLDALERHRVHEAVLHRPDDRDLHLDRDRAVLRLLEELVMRRPRSILACVSASRSDPNCAKAASSRNCARSPFSCPATCFIALSCAADPTRETEMPTEIAGRMPW